MQIQSTTERLKTVIFWKLKGQTVEETEGIPKLFSEWKLDNY